VVVLAGLTGIELKKIRLEQFKNNTETNKLTELCGATGYWQVKGRRCVGRGVWW
jgi:hypothetical protein